MSLSNKDSQKLKRLKQDGIIILIDKPMLEKTLLEMQTEDSSLTGYGHISYGELVKVIARGDVASQQEPRRILATYLVTSKNCLTSSDPNLGNRLSHFKPPEDYLKKHNIELVISPDEREFDAQKGVECTLARIMTQEVEGINIMRLGMLRKPPKRTFCIVSGNFDFVDVVEWARRCGCHVEIWFWKRNLSKEWRDQRVKERCRAKSCGDLKISTLKHVVHKVCRPRNTEARM